MTASHAPGPADHDPPPAHLIASTGLSSDEVADVLAAHRRALATGAGVLKDDRRTALTRVQHGDACLCVKEFRRAGGMDALKDLLRRSRASRAWAGSRILAERGISTPDPLALVASGGARYLVTRFLADATSLDTLITEWFAFSERPLAKHDLLRELGAWLRSVHDRGIYHDDWSPKNILAMREASGWRFWFLDTESISACKRLNDRRRAKNLAQLSDSPYGITATDRFRLLRSYAAGRDCRRLARAALAFARKREESWVRVKARAARRVAHRPRGNAS
jgi:tRNA A-37 threonylcarbamoyl transferase component Bud32